MQETILQKEITQETTTQAPQPETADTLVPGKDDPATLQSESEIQSGEDANTRSEIVVTGSRIRRPNLESTVPITSIGGEQLLKQGTPNIGDTSAR